MTISVIIPLYNSERYLGETLESLLAQTRLPDEILVIDDGSVDGSAAIVQAFLPRFEGRMQYHPQPHRGAAATCNVGFQLATGELIAFLDSDDLWVPTKLADQLAAFAMDPELALLFGQVEQFRSPDLYADPALIPPVEMMVGHIPSALMMRRSALHQIGLYDPAWQVGYFPDWFLRARKIGVKMQTLPQVVAKRRLHADNLGRHKRAYQVELARILQRDLAWRQSQGMVDQGLILG